MELAFQLTESIKELGKEDYKLGNNSQTKIYFDADSQELYSLAINNSYPAEVLQFRHVLLMRVPDDAIAASVEAAMMDVLEDLQVLAKLYRGCERTDSGFVGNWVDGSNELIQKIQGELERQSIGTYSSPSEFFDDSLQKEFKTGWWEGRSAEKIIDAAWLGDDDGRVDRDDAIAWLEEEIDEWKESQEKPKFILEFETRTGLNCIPNWTRAPEEQCHWVMSPTGVQLFWIGGLDRISCISHPIAASLRGGDHAS